MKAIKTVCLLMLCATMALAKNSKDFSKKFKQAQDLFVDSNYTDALPLYLDLYKMDSSNANINYKLGYCYAHANQGRPKAVKYLERAVTATSGNYKEGSEDERNAPLDAYFRLGEAYHFIGKFDAAIQNYEKYKLAAKDRKNAGDEALMAQVDRKIQISKNAKTIVSRPIKIKIQNMGKNVNSAYGDYAPIVTADQSTLIFTSRRPETTGGD
ncbi:MAG TPA: tetratricopeptide repeat protein, partial [Cytophagales bacterium]|nr:tetratricopeptide repeat protein [Cytophagales bacterium]